MKSYRTILAVDCYELLMDGRLIVSRHPNLILTGEAAIGLELLTLLDQTSAELVLFSVSAPNRNKLSVMKTVARKFPHLRLMCLQHSKGLCPAGGAYRMPSWNDVANEGKGRFLSVTRWV